jgi:putative endonuclease
MGFIGRQWFLLPLWLMKTPDFGDESYAKMPPRCGNTMGKCGQFGGGRTLYFVIPVKTGTQKIHAPDHAYQYAWKKAVTFTFWYILASKRNGTLYIGVTSSLAERVWSHKNNRGSSFTRQYHVHRLVYFEHHKDIETAIAREKSMKKWRRKWKLELIEKFNPEWRDFYPDVV